MDNINLKEIKQYAVRRKDILANILDITKRRKFKGDPSEVDEFTEYLNIRQPYVDQLVEIKEKSGGSLKSFVPDFDSGDLLHTEISQILSESDSIAAKITDLDAENNKNMQRLTESLMGEVKKINVSKKARNSYNFFQMQTSPDNAYKR